LNPVRAGLVNSAEQYCWSSHEAYLGRPSPGWLSVDPVLSLLSPDPAAARSLYRQFIQGSDDEESALDRGGCPALAAPQRTDWPPPPAQDRGALFHASLSHIIQAAAGTVELSPRALAQPGKARQPARGRALAAFLVQECPHLVLEELARRTGRDGSSLSKAAESLRRRLAYDPVAKTQLETARSLLLLRARNTRMP
jgi:hypothetical protein